MQSFRTTTFLVVFLCGSAQVGTVSAHHSIQAQFDVNKTVTVSGTVAKVEYINPHSYLTVDVEDVDGATTRWAFEMAAAGQLRRAGMSRADRGGLKTGDSVTVIALAARNGSNTGLVQILRMPDGREINFTPDPTGP
jgi:DNA/RNA endonuclease YhcR with UshA esterase domain